MTAFTRAAVRSEQEEDVDLCAEESFWLAAHQNEPVYDPRHPHDEYAPAYRAGFARRLKHSDRSWEQIENELRPEWLRERGTSRLDWAKARNAACAGWHRADNSLSLGG